MIFEGLFVLELFLLYLLSHNVSIHFSGFFYHLTRNKKLTVNFLAFLFLPGTILHELAHWLYATLLFVPAGNIKLRPKIAGNGVVMGSVAVAKTDPFRRLLIGTAPVFIGISILVGSIYFASRYNLLDNYWGIALLAFTVFEIGNTMFSSKKDMEGTIGLLIIIILLSGILYLLGIRAQPELIVDFLSKPFIVSIFLKGSLYLLFPIIIDVIFISVLRILRK